MTYATLRGMSDAGYPHVEKPRRGSLLLGMVVSVLLACSLFAGTEKPFDPLVRLTSLPDAETAAFCAAAAEWWCKVASRTVRGDTAVFAVSPGGKGLLGLKAAGVSLKPNTRYRASCYLTTHLNDLPFVQIKKGSGFLFELAEDSARQRLYRVTGIFGERPRESHGFEFETGDAVGDGGYFGVHMYGVSGTVEMDGLAVMEQGPVARR